MRLLINIFCIICLFIGFDLVGQDPVEAQINGDKEATAYEKTNSAYFLIEASKFVFLEDYDQALVHLDKALELDKKNHAALFKKAEILVAQEKFKEALAATEQAIELQKENKYYYLLAAQIHKAQNEISQSADMYRLMISQVQGWELYGEEIVDTFTEAQEYDAALALMPRLLTFYPNYPELYLKKAELEIALKMKSASISTLAEGYAKFPEDPTILSAYVQELTKNGSRAEAVSLLQRQAEIDYKARLLLLDLLSQEKELEQIESLVLQTFEDEEADLESKLLAMGYLLETNQGNANQIDSLQQTLVASNPENPLVYENGGYVYNILANQSQGEARATFYAKAIAAYKSSAQLNPTNFDAWLRVFDYEVAQTQWKELLEDVEYLLDLYPNQALLFYYYAEAYRGLEDLEEALGMTDQGLRMGGRNPLLKSLLLAEKAKILTAQNKNEEADALFNQALNTEEVDERAIYAYAIWLTKVNPKAAIELIKGFSDGLSRSTEWTIATANAYVAQNDLKNARRVYENAFKETPSLVNAQTIEGYGDILFALGDVEGALRQWEKALTLVGFSKELQEKIEKKSIN